MHKEKRRKKIYQPRHVLLLYWWISWATIVARGPLSNSYCRRVRGHFLFFSSLLMQLLLLLSCRSSHLCKSPSFLVTYFIQSTWFSVYSSSAASIDCREMHTNRLTSRSFHFFLGAYFSIFYIYFVLFSFTVLISSTLSMLLFFSLACVKWTVYLSDAHDEIYLRVKTKWTTWSSFLYEYVYLCVGIYLHSQLHILSITCNTIFSGLFVRRLFHV